MVEINSRQGTDRGLLLQRASDASHQRAYQVERLRILVSLAFVAAALVATLFPPAAPVLAIAGGAWAVLSFVLSGVTQKETRTAATIQHEFDTWLFDLPWGDYAGEKVADEELHRRARQSKLPEARVRTWYPDVVGLPDVYAVLACQRENLSWDGRLRRRWATLLVVTAVGWVSLGVLIGLIADLSVRTICLRWFAPSSAGIVLAFQMAKSHTEIAAEKESLITLVRAELEVARPGDPDPADVPVLRDRSGEVQRRIFDLRRRTERVPRWLYERHRDSDEADMQATVAGLRAQLGL